MSNSSHRLFCRLDGLAPAAREQKRANVSKSLGLLETESVPVFDEATQTAARFLEVPICFLGIMVHDRLWIKASVGLSRLGLMNPLATSRQIPRSEAYCTYVVDAQQTLCIEDTLRETVFAGSILAQHYHVRSYLGTPLVTHDGFCIGTLAVMDTVPRQFAPKDIEFLALIARWCLREFERDHLLQARASRQEEWGEGAIDCPSRALETLDRSTRREPAYSISDIKLELLGELTRELRTPLTTVIGMASILGGEVFGPLTHKQKEYVKLIHNSGQQLNTLVNEILRLETTREETGKPNLVPVNLEMLCQQILGDLSSMAAGKRQELRLSVEPGKRLFLLDKEKVQQALYYLVASSIESSETGGEVRVHISRRAATLNIALWVTHPWLGDGLPQVKLYASALANGSVEREILPAWPAIDRLEERATDRVLTIATLEENLARLKTHDGKREERSPQALLGLLLACYLAEHQNGKIVIQGSPESGYRYVLQLPKIETEEG
ncbi:GAF domain-containing sensor histidine kinase [Pannus brasiliensis CCIBt3594]|uniref:histidine kinase n=1 Tax=Pannus brasiliensis CCIBt3594 TaxID=1427578 RepID=A0AAW9QL60_9CHRO